MAEVEIILSSSETLEADMPEGRFPQPVGSVAPFHLHSKILGGWLNKTSAYHIQNRPIRFFLLPVEQVSNSSSIPIGAWGDARCATNLSFAFARYMSICLISPLSPRIQIFAT